MSSPPQTWNPLPHDSLIQHTENLWTLAADLPTGSLKRVMTVVKQRHGKLLIHNGITVDPNTLGQLLSIGEPEHLIVPNGWHRLDCAAYQRKFPALRVWCPKGALLAVKKVVDVAGTLDDLPTDTSILCQHIPGTKDKEGVVLVHSLDGASLIFNDIIFNQAHLPGVEGFVLRLLGSTGGPKITNIARLALVRDKKAVRAFLQRMSLVEGLRRIIVSHGTMMTDPQVLAQIAATLG
jgi:hypothetical protein